MFESRQGSALAVNWAFDRVKNRVIGAFTAAKGSIQPAVGKSSVTSVYQIIKYFSLTRETREDKSCTRVVFDRALR